MSIHHYFASLSDVGRERSNNEDAHAELLLPDGSVLFVLCDGMGGHEAGDVASKLATEALVKRFQSSALANPASPNPEKDPRQLLYDGFMDASQAVLQHAQSHGRRGMGSTGVAAYLSGNQVTVGHAGDSRLYLLRDGRRIFQTQDHTKVGEMLRRGILTEEQAREHPESNVILRALGHATTSDGRDFQPEIQKEALELIPGDALLMCSDGLSDLVEDSEFGEILHQRSPEQAAQALVNLANERGGHDNITVTLYFHQVKQGVKPAPLPPKVEAVPTTPASAAAPSRNLSQARAPGPSQQRMQPTPPRMTARFGPASLLIFGAGVATGLVLAFGLLAAKAKLKNLGEQMATQAAAATEDAQRGGEPEVQPSDSGLADEESTYAESFDGGAVDAGAVDLNPPDSPDSDDASLGDAEPVNSQEATAPKGSKGSEDSKGSEISKGSKAAKGSERSERSESSADAKDSANPPASAGAKAAKPASASKLNPDNEAPPSPERE